METIHLLWNVEEYEAANCPGRVQHDWNNPFLTSLVFFLIELYDIVKKAVLRRQIVEYRSEIIRAVWRLSKITM